MTSDGQANQPLAWMLDGRCASTDPEAFFPGKGRPDQVRAAKRVCLNCDVRSECLTFALDNEEQFGIWGGKTARELRKIRRQTGAAA
jgi:WhiB family redox-sensing transcriptional regulator